MRSPEERRRGLDKLSPGNAKSLEGKRCLVFQSKRAHRLSPFYSVAFGELDHGPFPQRCLCNLLP